MREYRPQRSAVLSMGALALLCLGLGVFVLLGLLTMRERQDPKDLQAQLWLYGPVLLLLVAGAGAFGRLMLSILATYRIDPHGITRIVLGQQRLLLWRDVVDFQSGRLGQFGTIWTLTDNGGRKLKICTGLMERGYGLDGFLHAYSAPVRAQKHAQIRLAPQVYRYGKAPGTLMLVCGLFFLCFVVGAFAARAVQPGSGWAVILPMCVLVFGGFGAVSLMMAAYYFTYAVRITAETITESSLFSAKTLSFQDIAAFYTGEMPLKNGQMQRITELVGKSGKKIKVDAQLVDYDALTAALRSSMAAPVLEQGKQEKAIAGRSFRRQQAKMMMVAGPLAMLLTVGLAALLSGDSFTGLARQNRLDSEGRPTRGVVTGRWSKREGKSSTGWYLSFEFQAAGRTYQRSSPVTWDDYNSISNGSPARVVYVPSDPTISRMTLSIGRRKAIGQMAGLGLCVLLAVPAGISLCFRGWKSLRTEDTADENASYRERSGGDYRRAASSPSGCAHDRRAPGGAAAHTPPDRPADGNGDAGHGDGNGRRRADDDSDKDLSGAGGAAAWGAESVRTFVAGGDWDQLWGVHGSAGCTAVLDRPADTRAGGHVLRCTADR